MARFLFCSYGQEGHLHPALPIAKVLRDRGHQVAYMTAEHKAETIRALGIEYIRPRRWKASLAEATYDAKSTSLVEGIKEMYRAFRHIAFPDGLALYEDLQDAYAQFPADVLVGSQVTYGVPAFAKKRGLVWATHCILPTYPYNSRDQFPWSTGKGFARTPVEKLVAKAMRGASTAILRPLVLEWRSKLKKLGIDEPVHENLVGFVHSPHLFTVPSAPGFDLPRSDLPPQVKYVGTCLFHEGKEQAEFQSPFQDDKPLVYCTSGTLFIQQEFYKRAFAAAEGQDFNLLAVIGRNVDPAVYGKLPPNVHIEPYLPQNMVMKKTALVLAHGGGGTIMSALAHGVPVINIPFASDQPENALRVERLGAGLFLQRAGCTPEVLRAAMQRVLKEPKFREAAQAFGKVVLSHDGPKNAADELEKIIPASARGELRNAG